ncbi:MAG TPA: J domain-containing protein [Armatimonadota bacterium]|nr:J domain-containing protein [Armatimonadota bacterium]
MSLGYRMWRIARRRVLNGLGLGDGPAGSRRDPAREELDQFLREQEDAAASRAKADSGAPRDWRRPPPGPPRRPSSPPPHPYAADYALLGAPVGADFATVQHSWRRLVRETHPDRFAGQPEEQQRASDRLRAINEAYHRLAEHLQADEGI